MRRGELEGLNKVLEQATGLDRAEVIKEIAKRGGAADAVLDPLATHAAPPVRLGVLEILVARDRVSESAFAKRVATSAIVDPDISVRVTACQLAMLIKLWNVLEKTLRTDGAGRVRAGAIRGLLASPDWPIASSSVH